MPSMLDALTTLEHEFCSIVDRVDLPARQERRRALPAPFLEGSVGEWLRKGLAADGALWNHQSIGLESIARDRSVVLATDTASGKSLVFHIAAFTALMTDPEARVIVFYPQIALANDQLVHWRAAAAAAGLPSDVVGEIHGGVRMQDRLGILASARVVLMTPDVCQAWFLRGVATPQVEAFLAQLRAVYLDEAHVFEGVMGSNVALLTRRLAVVRSCARKDRKVEPLRIVAASATIANPGAHLHALFGADVDVVGVDQDGSPSYSKTLLHVAADDQRQAAIVILKELLQRSDIGTFIAFADSRQGVERIARDLEHDGIRPYRSGYEQEDRRAIEDALRRGELRGVVSTSALELGINIPHFSFGLNIGIPNSRKALRQRVGRVGRSQPGVFAIIAERFAFRRLGSTLSDYWAGSVEPSHLYLHNRFIQFAHARCLAEELEAIGHGPTPLPEADWPSDFKSIYALALPGSPRPPEFDTINALGADDPHRNYPLCNVGEVRYAIVNGPDRVGDIALQQAIREAYPGAVYLHLMRPYRVHEWRTSVFDRAIRVGHSGFPGPTKPISRTWVNAAVEPQGIVENHYLSNEAGFLTECQLQITERVEGYEERGTKHLYADLRAKPGMKSKMREFRTTGVLFRVSEDWFRLPENKRCFAAALRELVLREYSIAPQDLDVSYTNISLLQAGRRLAIADAVVLFDSTYGSLRLSEPAFTSAAELVDRLKRAIGLVSTPEEAPVPLDFVERLEGWLGTLAPCEVLPPPNAIVEGQLRVYRPGSIVARRGFNSGTPVDTVVIEPMLMEGPTGQELCYKVRDLGGREYILQQSAIVAVGDEWHEALWNPLTGEFTQEEVPDGEPSAAPQPIPS